MLKGLYAITDEKLTPYETIVAQATQLLENGIKVLQLRDKSNSDEFLLPFAIKLNALCREFNATFIINDRVNLAVKSNAMGLHIGLEDENFSTCRSLLKDKIIGVSCYGSLELARKAQNLGADYVAFGACFNSPTKPNAPTIDLNILHLAKKELHIPICAIGGITPSNIKQVKVADMPCVISSAYTPNSIKENLKAIHKALGI